MTHTNTRKCTKCLEELPLTAFYSKGNRTDSRCRECVKSTKRTKYVSANQELNFNTLMRFFALVHELEIIEINNTQKKLDEVIEQCQKQIQQ